MELKIYKTMNDFASYDHMEYDVVCKDCKKKMERAEVVEQYKETLSFQCRECMYKELEHGKA